MLRLSKFIIYPSYKPYMKKPATIAIIILVLLIASLAFISVRNRTKAGAFSGDTIRVGYIVYPPLLEKNPTTGKFSGISYDIVEAVAKKLNLKTEWTEEVGWGTALEGLNTNRYDILGTQMWPNEAREKVVMFSVAPMNSVIYPYVKKGDTLPLMCFKIYGDSKYYVQVAAVNRLSDFRNLQVGNEIFFPPFDKTKN